MLSIAKVGQELVRIAITSSGGSTSRQLGMRISVESERMQKRMRRAETAVSSGRTKISGCGKINRPRKNGQHAIDALFQRQRSRIDLRGRTCR